ncbi:MAG TPA: AraC family transcriptional regulator [Bryobacteraceae bacterium]|jgi:AraC family transcriptional regulator|nr:AraC family transcriptional regulator [Bryobacteraceae bacterium]
MALTEVSLSAPLAVRMQTDPAGILDVPARPFAGIVIHVGAPVHIVCDRAGQRHAGVGVHGDVDLIPGFAPSRWELSEPDTAVILGLPIELLAHVAEVSGADSKRVEILNRFQIRDSRVEHIGWAAKAEMEAGYPNGRLYLDGLATALAVHLVNRHTSGARAIAPVKGAMPPRRLKQVLGYIEEHIAEPLSLVDLARAAGIGVSQFSASFRVAMGQSAHQYVTRRRVERAEDMLRQPDSSISQVATDTGFSHASHMAYQMRKILGISPTEAASRRRTMIAAVGF